MMMVMVRRGQEEDDMKNEKFPSLMLLPKKVQNEEGKEADRSMNRSSVINCLMSLRDFG